MKRFDLLLITYLKESVLGTEQRFFFFCVEKCIVRLFRLFVFWFESSKRQTAGPTGSFCSREKISILCLNTFRVCETFDLLLITFLKESFLWNRTKKFLF